MPPIPSAIDADLLLRALAGSTPDLVYAVDRNGRYSFVSELGAQILGFTPEQMIGRTWSEIGLPPEREQEFLVERDRVMATGVAEKREVTFPMPDGERMFEYVVSPLIDDDGLARGVVVVSRDTTDRNAADRALRQELQFRKAIERSLTSGLLTFSRNGRITYVSPAFTAMTGFTEEELRATTAPYPFWPAEEWPHVAQVYEIAKRGETLPRRIETVYSRKSGERFPVSVEPSPLVDEGVMIGWLSLITDLSEQRRMAGEIVGREAALQRQNATLRSLLGVAEMLSSERDLPKLIQAVTEAAKNLAGAEVGAFYYDNDPRQRDSETFASNLTVPVMSKSGALIGHLVCGHSQPAMFDEESEQLVAGVAA